MLSDPDAVSPLEVRLRIWTESGVRAELTESTGRVSASCEIAPERVLRAHWAWNRARSKWSGEVEPLREVGEVLGAILSESVRAALQEAIGIGLAEGRSVRVRVDSWGSELADVPWEWLYLRPTSPLDPAEGPLGLVPNVHIWRESIREGLSREGQMRFLVVASDPSSARFARLPWLATEVRSIASAFALSRRRNVELRTLMDASPAVLEAEIAEFRPHGLHFVGHGESQPGGGVLALNGPRVRSERFLKADRLLEWLVEAETRFVFLSACDTAGTEDSFARTLVSGGVPTVVAMQTPVSDAAQPHFARVFYGSILSGTAVDEAVAEARQSLGGASAAWASPVLFASDPPLSLFEPYVGQGRVRGPHDLPVYDSPIVGRDAEVDETVRRMHESSLVVLTGPGGIGKTRIAVEAATLVANDFADGVYLVECDACENGEDVLFAIARTLGIEQTGKPVLEDVVESLGGRTLLVLDGLEGVVASGGQSVLRHLLDRCPVSLLATSRFRLEMEGEVFREVLPLDEGRKLILQNAGLTGKRLTPDEERSLTEICRALEGVPLALVIAAGRLRFLQIEQLATLLRESPLSTLGGQKSDVGAAIRRSLTLVSEEDRRLLRDLTVFAGAFSWDDLAEVYPEDRFEMLEGLSRLVDRSLLSPENAAERRRYRILGSLREYMGRLPKTPEEAARVVQGQEAHLRLFAERAKAIGRSLDLDRWLEGVAALWDALPNLRAAFDFAIERGQAEEAEALCRSLARTLMEAGMWSDFERTAHSGYLVAERDDRPRLAAYLLSLEGAMRSRRGDYDGAERVWRRRIELCRTIGFSLAAADAMLDLAAQSVETGRLDEAYGWIEAAAGESLCEDRIDLRPVLATVRCRYYDALGDYARAAECAGEAEALLGPASTDQTIFVYTSLARVWRRQGEHARVRQAMAGILRGAVEGERRAQAATALVELARTLREEGFGRLAARCQGAAVATLRELGSHRLRSAERQYKEEYRREGTDGWADATTDRPWNVQIVSILDQLEALIAEET